MRRTVALAAGMAAAVAGAVALSIPAVHAATGPVSSAQQAHNAAGALAFADPPNISVANVKAHLSQFQSFANANGGNRYSGRGGYTASLNYVEQKLRAVGYSTTRQTCTSGCSAGSVNLIAEWPGGDPNRVYMFGAHLDGVAAGPGINDNGSGSGGILEVALQIAARNPTMANKLRFGWWSDEEQGLRGSRFYVSTLSTTERAKIKIYYNFDMIGSPNGGYFINNITTAGAANLKAFYNSIGVTTLENTEGANRSDDASFRNGGIASTGVAAGASYTKTSQQAQMWGGTAGAAYDRCYHASCDTTSNINDTILDRATDAISYAAWRDTVGTGTTSPTPTRTPTTTPPTTTPPGDCTGYQNNFTGSLSSGASAYQPNNSYFQTTGSGSHSACLDGPSGTDYDLYLQKWNGSAWANVASGTTASADERLTYSGTAGYYRYRIHAYSGSGSYSLGYNRPA